MGRLNDLLVLAANNHDVRPDQERPVNDRLAWLRAAIREDATALRHDLA